MRSGQIRKYFARGFFWVILPFFLIEILLTVLDPYLFKGAVQYDSDLGFKMRPYHNFNGVLSNQFGFNDQDYSLQKPEGTFRVLVVGDSFNWLGGRDGNYVGRLRQKLKERYGDQKIEVINAGYPGTHPGEQLAMLKKYGLQYHPDLVVLGFFVGNDFAEAEPNRKTIIINDSIVRIDRRNERKFLGYPIVLQSRLLLFLKQRYTLYRDAQQAKKEAEAEGKPRPKGTFSEENFLNIERARLEICNLKSQSVFRPHIEHTYQNILEMDALLKSRGIDFMLAIYPDEFQVNQKLHDHLFDKYKISRADFNLSLPQDLLKSFLSEKGIPHVDLLKEFKVEGQTRDLYLYRNTHWNESGNQLAADILFRELVLRLDQTSLFRTAATRN